MLFSTNQSGWEQHSSPKLQAQVLQKQIQPSEVGGIKGEGLFFRSASPWAPFKKLLASFPKLAPSGETSAGDALCSAPF